MYFLIRGFEKKPLFQAPTPTRFIGKMHAVVAKDGEKRKTSASKGTDVPETISEVLILNPSFS